MHREQQHNPTAAVNVAPSECAENGPSFPPQNLTLRMLVGGVDAAVND
jgi:hypothetical protein